MINAICCDGENWKQDRRVRATINLSIVVHSPTLIDLDWTTPEEHSLSRDTKKVLGEASHIRHGLDNFFTANCEFLDTEDSKTMQ